MNREQWQTHIIHAVAHAARGHPERLAELAQLLADHETAHEALVCAGVGSEGDGLMDLVAMIVESKQELDNERT